MPLLLKEKNHDKQTILPHEYSRNHEQNPFALSADCRKTITGFIASITVCFPDFSLNLRCSDIVHLLNSIRSRASCLCLLNVLLAFIASSIPVTPPILHCQSADSSFRLPTDTCLLLIRCLGHPLS